MATRGTEMETMEKGGIAFSWALDVKNKIEMK